MFCRDLDYFTDTLVAIKIRLRILELARLADQTRPLLKLFVQRTNYILIFELA